MGEKIKKMIQELNYSISSIEKNGLKSLSELIHEID